MKLKYEDEIEIVRNELKEKTKENKRLVESYKIAKQNNDGLKNQVCIIYQNVFNIFFIKFKNFELQEKCTKFEKQFSTLNYRFNNLQVCC